MTAVDDDLCVQGCSQSAFVKVHHLFFVILML